MHEDEYAYDIILRLGREFLKRGAKVHFIIQDRKGWNTDQAILNNSKRETCMGKTIPLNQVPPFNSDVMRSTECTGRIRAATNVPFLSMWTAGTGNNQTDVYFYHAPGSKYGKRLAQEIQRTFKSKYNRYQPNRGSEGTVSDRNLFVLRNTTPVAVFLEVGNIQNAQDQKRLVIADNRQALANWITAAIEKDYRKSK